MLRKTDLHDYQNEVVTEMYERDNLLAICPMGAGKTVSALTAIDELLTDGVIGAAIVLAPKRVAQDTWPKELDEWAHLQELDLVVVSGSPERRKRILDETHEVYVVGIDNTQWLTDEMRAWDEDDPRFDLLCIDEVSRYKSPTGKRSRSLAFLADRFRIRWGLTGTPAPNGEEDLYMPCRLLARKAIWPEPFTEWRMKYFIPDNPVTQFHWDIRDEWRDKIWRDVAAFSHTIDADRLPETPEPTPVEHWVDLPKKAVDAFNDMVRHLIVELGEKGFVEAVNRGVASGKLDQIAQGFIYRDGETLEQLHTAKLDKLKDLVEGLGGQQAMITYWFKEDLYQLRKTYGDHLPVLGSATSEARADEAIQQWNDRETQLIAVHPASAGHGLNLQKSHAGQIIHYSPTWSAELDAQVNARIARQGNKSPTVLSHYILARGTMDRVKRDRVIGKLTTQEAFANFVSSYNTEN